MGVGRPQHRCRWVRDRLPLLAGGELTGSDRRALERHLIGCDGCRRVQRSTSSALGALRAAAAEAPVGFDPGADAPSLWPALARQIRESRHASPAAPSPFERLAEFWDDALARPRPALAAVLALVLASGLGAGLWTRGRIESARAAIAEASRPVPSFAGPSRGPALPVSAAFDPSDLAYQFEYDLEYGRFGLPVAAPPPEAPIRIASTKSAPRGRSRPKGELPAEEVPVARVDFDLERGSPMGLDPRDAKASY